MTVDARRRRLLLGLPLIALGAVGAWWSLRLFSISSGDLSKLAGESVVIRLVDEARRAKVDTETRLIRFGLPSARPHYEEADPKLRMEAHGFKSLVNESGEACAVAVGRKASVRFFSFDRTSRQAVLEAAGLDDGPQQIEVRLNGAQEPLAVLEPARGDRVEEFAFLLPEAQLVSGSNRLEFSLARSRPWNYASEQVVYPYSAVFRSLRIGRPGEPVDPGDPVPEIAVAFQPAPSLVVPQGTRIAFALRLPTGDSRLRTRLRIHPEDRPKGAVSVAVRLLCDTGERLLLLRAELEGTEAAEEIELERELSVFKGEPVSLQVDVLPAAPGVEAARVVLADPVIEGRQLPGAPGPDVSSKVHPLRERLKGRNLVLITLDAAAAAHFDAYGATAGAAPHVDLIAAKGIVFEDMTSPASYTLAGVGSLLTGQYPDTHGVVAIGTEAGTLRLSGETTTMAERFQQAGYHTVALTTNPNAGAQFGFARGFDHFDALYEPAQGFWNEGVAAEVLAPRLAEHLARGWLKEPFLLSLHVFQPHAPYRPPPEYLEGLVDETYQGPADGSRASIDAYKFHTGPDLSAEDFAALAGRYRANLSYADRAVRELLAVLKEHSLLDGTVVTVLSDHGEALGEHHSLEHGDTVHAEQVEVPWILLLPGDVGLAPLRVPGPGSLVDVAPTLLSLLSIDPGSMRPEGIDRTPALLGALEPERPIFLRSSGAAPAFGVRAGGFAYQEDLRTRRTRLFQLDDDPGEQRPLERERPILAEVLRAELCRFLCRRAGHKGEAAEMSEELLRQMQEIGYLQTEAQSQAGCPLVRQALVHSTRSR